MTRHASPRSPARVIVSVSLRKHIHIDIHCRSVFDILCMGSAQRPAGLPMAVGPAASIVNLCGADRPGPGVHCDHTSRLARHYSPSGSEASYTTTLKDSIYPSQTTILKF